MAGWKWIRGFHSSILLRTPENTSMARAEAFNKNNIAQYFENLSTVMDKHNFLAKNIYNVDESGLVPYSQDQQKYLLQKAVSKRGLFGPLQVYYDQEVQLWLKQNPGRPVTPFHVAGIFNKAYLKAATPSNAINAYSKTGISPLNPSVFEDWMFSPSLTTDGKAVTLEPGALLSTKQTLWWNQ
ncbi:hypothetical protein NQ317_011062 [Molorchus minor]|uniref:Uncharacterized protein n=1 Tax=Molorchus minor TaxID=1323400 RepID=A0ABQ9J3M5_9CUCU|nr:hypothetical protein NQ317_011062 [Molorchus minor]